MNVRVRRRRDERGAALILAIAFLVVVGGISAALVSSITSGANERVALDDLRNRQYAADAAIEQAIAQLRFAGGPNVGYGNCLPGQDTFALNDVTIQVACANALTFARNGNNYYLQRNVIFTACVADPDHPKCAGIRPIIRAQVNFDAVGDPLVIQRTWVQSWSVNA
jgi:hypothetical protein